MENIFHFLGDIISLSFWNLETIVVDDRAGTKRYYKDIVNLRIQDAIMKTVITYGTHVLAIHLLNGQQRRSRCAMQGSTGRM